MTLTDVGMYNFCLCDTLLSSTKFMFENCNQSHKKKSQKYVLTKFMILVLGPIYGYPCCMWLQVGHT